MKCRSNKKEGAYRFKRLQEGKGSVWKKRSKREREASAAREMSCKLTGGEKGAHWIEKIEPEKESPKSRKRTSKTDARHHQVRVPHLKESVEEEQFQMSYAKGGTYSISTAPVASSNTQKAVVEKKERKREKWGGMVRLSSAAIGDRVSLNKEKKKRTGRDAHEGKKTATPSGQGRKT